MAYYYLPCPDERGGLTATELLFSQMPCYFGSRDCANDPGAFPDTCSLCWEVLGPKSFYRQLPCGHIFHLPCINCWLQNEDASCPLCRCKFYYLRRPRLVYSAATCRAFSKHNFPMKSYFRAMKSWLARRVFDR